MKQVGFPVEDELVQLVDEARDRLQRLRMWLHYRVDEEMNGRSRANSVGVSDRRATAGSSF
jgi:hypothetical protein